MSRINTDTPCCSDGYAVVHILWAQEGVGQLEFGIPLLNMARQLFQVLFKVLYDLVWYFPHKPFLREMAQRILWTK